MSKTFKISVKGSGTEPKEPSGKIYDKNIQDSVKGSGTEPKEPSHRSVVSKYSRECKKERNRTSLKRQRSDKK